MVGKKQEYYKSKEKGKRNSKIEKEKIITDLQTYTHKKLLITR